MVYRRVAELASATLASGYAVVTDAVYGREDEREVIAGVARDANVRFDGLWLEGPQTLLEQRIATRVGDASDATAEILRFQLDVVTRAETWATIDATGSAFDSLDQARQALRG